MSKKQVLLTSLVVALPAAALVAVLVVAGFQGHANNWSGILWAVNVLAGLGAAVIAASPVLIGLLYPAEGFAAAGAVTENPNVGEDFSAPRNQSDDDSDDDDDDAPVDDGEQLFEDDALEDSFDDDFEGSFDDDDSR